MKQAGIKMLGLLFIYLIIPFAFGENLYVMSLLVSALIFSGAALAWALLGNLGGMVSFGHAAFFGVGAYTSALLTLRLHWPVFPSILMAGAGAAAAATVMLPALRLRGPYFALAILAYAHIFRILATEWEGLTGGAGGLSQIPHLPVYLGVDFGSKIGGYITIATLVLLFAALYTVIRSSPHGLALIAMHDSEEATRMVGVNSTLLKAAMLFVSAAMTGMVGAFNAHYINFLEPDYAFSGVWTVMPIIAAIFGGYRTITGPVIGALIIYLMDQLIFKSIIPIGHEIILGAVLVLMILLSPKGVVPFIGRRLKGGAGA